MTLPLTPADCDLSSYKFMPVDIIRLFGSRFHAIANDSEWRAGVTLWLKSFHQVPAASLPDDDIELCRLAELGRDAKAWKKIREKALHGWIKCDDGRLYHPVVAEKAIEAWEGKRQKASNRSADAERLRAWRERQRNAREIRFTETPETSDETPPETSVKLVRKGKGKGNGKREGKGEGSTPPTPPEGDGRFNRFWAAYPRKVARAEAQKAFAKAIPNTTIDAILAAIERTQWAPDPRYQPHPATWLNGQRWLDQTDTFDPVLRAVGLEPEDFDDPQLPMGLLQ